MKHIWKDTTHLAEYRDMERHLRDAIRDKKYTASCFGVPPFKKRAVGEYPTAFGAVSFFKNFYNIIFVARGSIFGSLIPQLVVAVFCSLLAAELELKISSRGHVIISVPLSFLLVFKTQCSYSQYWEGRGHIGELVRATRTVCMEALSFMRKDGDNVLTDDDKREDVFSAESSAQVCRLMKIYYFLVMEHVRT